MERHKISGFLCMICIIINIVKGGIFSYYFMNYIGFVVYGFLSIFHITGAILSFKRVCTIIDYEGLKIKITATRYDIFCGFLLFAFDILYIFLLINYPDDPSIIHHVNSVSELIIVFSIFISAELLLIMAGIIDDTSKNEC